MLETEALELFTGNTEQSGGQPPPPSPALLSAARGGRMDGLCALEWESFGALAGLRSQEKNQMGVQNGHLVISNMAQAGTSNLRLTTQPCDLETGIPIKVQGAGLVQV